METVMIGGQKVKIKDLDPKFRERLEKEIPELRDTKDSENDNKRGATNVDNVKSGKERVKKIEANNKITHLRIIIRKETIEILKIVFKYIGKIGGIIGGIIEGTVTYMIGTTKVKNKVKKLRNLVIGSGMIGFGGLIVLNYIHAISPDQTRMLLMGMGKAMMGGIKIVGVDLINAFIWVCTKV